MSTKEEKNNNFEYWEGHENINDVDSVRFAVDWFGEKLRHPSFEEENIDERRKVLRTRALELYTNTSPEQRETEIREFQRILYVYLCRSLPILQQPMLLCDYQPIDILDTLSHRQKSLVFPPNTYMLVTNITVKVGSLDNITGNVEPIFVADKYCK
jgi:hypothetical protein